MGTETKAEEDKSDSVSLKGRESSDSCSFFVSFAQFVSIHAH